MHRCRARKPCSTSVTIIRRRGRVSGLRAVQSGNSMRQWPLPKVGGAFGFKRPCGCCRRASSGKCLNTSYARCSNCLLPLAKPCHWTNLVIEFALVGNAGVAKPACEAQWHWCGWELLLKLLQHDGQRLQGATEYLEPGMQSEHKLVYDAAVHC